MRDKEALDTGRLACITGSQLQELLSLTKPMPAQDTRAGLLREVVLSCNYSSCQQTLRGYYMDLQCRCIRGAREWMQVGQQLLACFDGRPERLIAQAQGSAARLVDIVTETFPGFRDCTVYK